MEVIAISSKLATLSSAPFGSHITEHPQWGWGPLPGALEKLIIVSISSLVILVADVDFSWMQAAILELRFKAKFSRPICNHNSDLQ